MAEQWDLLLTLPNLAVPVPSPFERDDYVICSADDPRLKNLAPDAGNATAAKMLTQFRTARGENYRPACFLIGTNIPIKQRDSEAIRAFRNVCAISCTTAAFAVSLKSPSAAQWRLHWSDQFKFGYFVSGQSGWIQTLDGASKGTDDKVPVQQPDPQFGKPSNWSLIVDEPLLNRLLRSWRNCYLKKTDRRMLGRLFRSLEVAFHALMYPADGMTSINDIGTRIALWISAFEVLAHPGQGSVNKRIVQKLISEAPFSAKGVTSTRYTISHQGAKIRVSLPEALYDDLYWARNQFLHGMPVRAMMLRYRQSKSYAQLLRIAPVLFNAALVSYLDRVGVPGGPTAFTTKFTVKNFTKYLQARNGIERVQNGIVAAGKPLE